MEPTVIYRNEYIKITSQADGVFIESFKTGFSLQELNSILSLHPQIEINHFSIVKQVITVAPASPQKVGKLKDRICIDIVDNDLKAFITFNLPKEDLDKANRQKLISETHSKLKEKGIIHGIKNDLFFEDMVSGRRYVIAEGTPPVDGTDCVIKMYELKEPKPEISEDGKANFYDLKLINIVKVGDWLGERINATDGSPGKSIKGDTLNQVKGKNYPLVYDKGSVEEIAEKDKQVLYAKKNGAVSYVDGKISVSDHLEIDGDVDLSTGNIKFDGYVTIKGTVTDGFYVEATKDIEINSDLGLGNVKGISSTGGSMFIKGGISARGGVQIKASKNFFTKFVDNAVIQCGETAHIGFYCINSTVDAREVIIDSSNGQIIGGYVKAQVRILSPIIGSEIEKRTVVEITGFDRNSFKDELESAVAKVNKLKDEEQKVKQTISRLDGQKELTAAQQKEYNQCFRRLYAIREEVKELEGQKKRLVGYLKVHGNGEIYVTKKMFPNCMVAFDKTTTEINTPVLATRLFIQNGELKQI